MQNILADMHILADYHLRELDDDHLVIGKGADGRKNIRHVVRLNASAAYLWRSVEGKEFDAGTLARLLQEKYGIDAAAAAADASAILSAWEKSGLVA